VRWPDTNFLRASVNNFGYGGTNSHVIIDDVDYHYRAYNNTSRVNGVYHGDDGGDYTRKLFVLSARDEAATLRMAANLSEYLRQQSIDIIKWNDLAFTLGQRRSNWSIAIPAQSPQELQNALSEKALKPVRILGRGPRLGFIFNG